MTALLRRAFDAEHAGAGDVDLRGTASRRWADDPAPALEQADFHRVAADHPLVTVYRQARRPTVLRLSDVPDHRDTKPAYEVAGMTRAMAIPLIRTPRYLRGLALMRSGADFSSRAMGMAQRLQPFLAGIHALRDRCAGFPGAPGFDDDLEIPLTGREIAVLDLMVEGLVSAAIAHRLGISPRTVSKHIASIYRKVGTQDRTSTVLRCQALGLLSPPVGAAVPSTAAVARAGPGVEGAREATPRRTAAGSPVAPRTRPLVTRAARLRSPEGSSAG